MNRILDRLAVFILVFLILTFVVCAIGGTVAIIDVVSCYVLFNLFGLDRFSAITFVVGETVIIALGGAFYWAVCRLFYNGSKPDWKPTQSKQE